MRILVAEDEPVSRGLLESLLRDWGYDVLSVGDGATAWQHLQEPGAPGLALLDWRMPGLEGPEVCRRVRALAPSRSAYLILLTARAERQDLLDGLRSGANDYVTKPFDADELRARLQIGTRIVELQESLRLRVRELEDALARVRQLHGLLPICSYCKKIRDDQNYWQRVEAYISQHADVQFTHSVCPECFEKVVKPEVSRLHDDGPDPGPCI